MKHQQRGFGPLSLGFCAHRKEIIPDHCAKRVLFAIVALLLSGYSTFAAPLTGITVGERMVVATKMQRDALGLKWFMDGNLGAVKACDKIQLYGANGSKPVRVTGTPQIPLHKVDPVIISTKNGSFRYLSGGPVYIDPLSKRIFLFYHAEIHRGTEAKIHYGHRGQFISLQSRALHDIVR